MVSDIITDKSTLVEKEIEFLIKSIEELSKHCRNILFILSISSVYVLIAAFSGTLEEKLKLPVLNVDVSTGDFFMFSPIIISIVYIYLHIYVRELRDRIFVFKKIDLECKYVPYSEMLLFPWILIFSENYNQSSGKPKSGMEDHIFLITNLTARFSIWLLGPLVLLALWLQHIGEEKILSIVPCIAVIGSNMASWYYSQRAKSVIITIFIMSGLIIGITLASIPELRSVFYLDLVWDLTKHKVNSTKNNTDLLNPFGIIAMNVSGFGLVWFFHYFQDLMEIKILYFLEKHSRLKSILENSKFFAMIFIFSFLLLLTMTIYAYFYQ